MRTSGMSIQSEGEQTTLAPSGDIFEYPYAFLRHAEGSSNEVDETVVNSFDIDIVGDDSTLFSAPLHPARPASKMLEPIFLSQVESCTIKASVRSDRGPVESILSDKVDNWSQDRFAKHNPCGAVWIQLDFPYFVFITRVIIDFESAFATEYDLEVSQHDEWRSIHRSPSSNMKEPRAWGCNPAGAPLHYEHDIRIPWHGHTTKSLRLFVHKPATNLGVSIWSIKVYGYTSNTGTLGQPTKVAVPRLLSGPVHISSSPVSYRPRLQHVWDDTDPWKCEWNVNHEQFGKGLWLRMDFVDGPVLLTQIVLEWGSFHSDKYDIEVGTTDDWHVVRKFPDPLNIGVNQSGISSNAIIEHSLNIPQHQPTSSIRIYMHQIANNLGGIVLRQIRVYGYKF